MNPTPDIDEVYRRALGADAQPFDYQREIALRGLPEALDVPTGCGKTAAVLLAWIYRRFFHPDEAVRTGTPTRLIWCQPLRTLTRQTFELVRAWTAGLGLEDQIDAHLLMGGEPVDDQRWRFDPGHPAVIVSTIDMALSRALNRGYLASRYAWPIDFALFNSDSHWVFDEVQLMGPALTTSRQLDGLRRALGTAKPTGTTWMSATIPATSLLTVDAPEPPEVTSLSTTDRHSEELLRRLEGGKALRCHDAADRTRSAAEIAELAFAEHQPGTLTLAVLNTVKDAQDVARRLRRLCTSQGEAAPAIELLHSRFRRADRDAALSRTLENRDPNGTIVVSTQVIEAGVDLSAATLVTALAPWASLVQRSGRCNRDGRQPDARVIIVRNHQPGPYDPAELDAAWSVARELDEQIVTPASLAAREVPVRSRPVPTLRRRDLLDLFDTAPDLSGNDIDVGRFIREGQELDVAVAWREFSADDPTSIGPPPTGAETCPVSLSSARELLKRTEDAFVEDSLRSARRRRGSAGVWRRAEAADLKPGAVLVVNSEAGCYSSLMGFDLSERKAVAPTVPATRRAPTPDHDTDDDEPLTTGFGRAVPLADHLLDVESECVTLCEQVGGVDDRIAAAVMRAGRLHDLGKAHRTFQEALPGPDGDTAADRGVLAKSGVTGTMRYSDRRRRGFRHELVSALVLLDQPALTDGQEGQHHLVCYLVAAHHGRVRLGARSRPGEPADQLLGVAQCDEMPAVSLGGSLWSAPARLDLAAMRLGGDGERSWTARALALLDEHGPFRLAWYEMLVRIADWRASAAAMAHPSSDAAVVSTPTEVQP